LLPILIHNPETLLRPHWLQPAFIGEDFARECVQILYEKITFIIHEEDLTEVDKLLTSDHYALGIDPSTYI
jgi:hypothetical protein